MLRRIGKLEVSVLAVIFVIGLIHLPQPFHDDQAFFTIGAWKMSHGAILYRDYWDIKQPGIFLFYLAGGKLFGFNEIGVHCLEMLYMLGLAGVLMTALQSYFEQRFSAALTALLTVGFYYGVSGLPHATLDYLTQVEGLVGFPMFLCLYFASRAAERKGSQAANLFISGLMGTLVLLFKLIFLPVLLCFWLASFLYFVSPEKNVFAEVRGFIIPTLLGLLVPLLAVCGYFSRSGSLTFLYYASLVWPVRAIGKLALPGTGRLHEGLEYFVDGFAPLLALGLVSTWWPLRNRRDIVTINLLIWIFVGIAIILVQVRSWWPHHYLLLFVPLGILGTKGVEILWQHLFASRDSVLDSRSQTVFFLALTLLFSPVIFPILTDALFLARYRFALNQERRLEYQCRYPHSQYLASSEFGFLSKPDSLPGPIYVAGSSLYYYLSGRLPAVAQCAGVDDFLPEQWSVLTKDLAAARPPYIFISTVDKALFEANSPKILDSIEADYHVLQEEAAGVWYVVKAEGSAPRAEREIYFKAPSPGCEARP